MPGVGLSSLVFSEHDVGAAGGGVGLDGDLGAVNRLEDVLADDVGGRPGTGDSSVF